LFAWLVTDKIKKEMSLMQHLSIDGVVQAKVFSKLWNADPVWLYNNIIKQKSSRLNTAVGSVLRHIVQDNEKAFNREELHNLLKIPSLIDWENYLTVSLARFVLIDFLMIYLKNFYAIQFLVRKKRETIQQYFLPEIPTNLAYHCL
jgi:hypothetical protein